MLTLIQWSAISVVRFIRKDFPIKVIPLSTEIISYIHDATIFVYCEKSDPMCDYMLASGNNQMPVSLRISSVVEVMDEMDEPHHETRRETEFWKCKTHVKVCKYLFTCGEIKCQCLRTSGDYQIGGWQRGGQYDGTIRRYTRTIKNMHKFFTDCKYLIENNISYRLIKYFKNTTTDLLREYLTDEQSVINYVNVCSRDERYLYLLEHLRDQSIVNKLMLLYICCLKTNTIFDISFDGFVLTQSMIDVIKYIIKVDGPDDKSSHANKMNFKEFMRSIDHYGVTKVNYKTPTEYGITIVTKG